ncbi:uncharacterized protein Z518_06259 [Rhinocladiella mackenziei CBS 650.93]|uniref:Rhinocladiella mackenziei CBS 650.93 unplaced genomic scaffold supercont1.4, whole genome shotgun sequence n=1 Tax=Rhinocladiella mackenziei CBS 650.93 TaxID=1442369 RepID=A0A0D2FTG8_9EURO|nr:uncharacterized protein Z518_06259 [Rhinocladiella mackenziei CBS 650.93]KIX05387.1 hypothetical protein Z518_06259 [Rhinocladiella mackenziei CBS 650.93]
MKAIAMHGNEAVVEKDRPLPKLRDDYVLVKTVAVALNPADWKHVAFGFAAPDGLLGCDFSGIVEQVGPAVTKAWSKGDRICGVAHGGNFVQPEDGAFAEYIVAKGDVQMKIPDGMSFEQAATISLGAATVGQGLYQQALKLNLPTDPVKSKNYVLIYGGSSATGALGVQYAKLSGYAVLSTCSPRNFEYVKSLGADAVFDYHDASAPATIRSYTSNTLTLAWDTISVKESAQFCADALSSDSKDCLYGAIVPMKCPRDDVKSTVTIMYSIFGEEFKMGPNTIPAISADYEFAKMFMSMTEKLLAEGKLKPHKEKVGKGGLEGVLKGLEDLKTEKVSGEKLVYLVDETP